MMGFQEYEYLEHSRMKYTLINGEWILKDYSYKNINTHDIIFDTVSRLYLNNSIK